MQPDTLTADDFANGEVIFHDPVTGVRYTKFDIDDKHYAIRKEYPLTQELLDTNAEDRSNSFGTRWGEGKIIGRVPLHLLQDENVGLGEALKNHDDAFVRRFLNENSKLKTRDRI